MSKKYKYIDGKVQEVTDQKKGIFRITLTEEDIKNGIQCGVMFNEETEFMKNMVQSIMVPAELMNPEDGTQRRKI